MKAGILIHHAVVFQLLALDIATHGLPRRIRMMSSYMLQLSVCICTWYSFDRLRAEEIEPPTSHHYVVVVLYF